jgi:RND family efflux transporter MFP subunit
MKKITALAFLILFAGSGSAGLSSCSKNAAADSTQTKTAEVFTVQTEAVKLAPMAATLSVTGTLEGTKEAIVQSETQGRILAIVRTIGDRVGAGAPLVKVDDELKVIAVHQATAQRLAAEAAFEKAQLDDQRNQELVKDNVITKSQLEMSQLQVKSADAMLKAAQSAESLAKRQLADATVKAPFAGVVSNRFVNQGEMLTPGTKVVTLVDDSRIKFRMFISEIDVVNLKVGSSVVVKVDALSGESYPGKITNISDKADQTHSYEVDVELQNPRHALKSGMFARAEIQRELPRDVPSVPNEAIIYSGTLTQVYVVEDGVAHLRTVKIGATSPQRVEITSGLNAGDQVVTFGQNTIHDNAKIRK